MRVLALARCYCVNTVFRFTVVTQCFSAILAVLFLLPVCRLTSACLLVFLFGLDVFVFNQLLLNPVGLNVRS